MTKLPSTMPRGTPANWRGEPERPPAAPPPTDPPRPDPAGGAAGGMFGPGPGVDALEPRHLAETLLALRYRAAGDATDYRLAHFQGRYFAWSDGAYRVVDDACLADATTLHAEAESHRAHAAALDAWAAAEGAREGSGGKRPTRKKVTRTVTGDAVAAVRCRVALPPAVVPPCWLTPRGDRPDPTKVIATTRGIIDPDTDDGDALAPTPELLAFAASPHFDPAARPPALWLKFLAQVLGDEASVGTLQEFAGLLLTADTSRQRFLYLIGPSGGKGTVVRVLSRLVGEEFVAGTSFQVLSEDHGVADLVGKSLAVMGDMRVGPRSDVSIGVSRFLSVTGEDLIAVNQKNRPVFTTRLSVRFLVAANELPNIQDSATAFAARAVVLRFPMMFRGTEQEDTGLSQKLYDELPGIFAWALAGLRRLNERKTFVQPGAGADTLRQITHATSPVTKFVDERCVVGLNESVPMVALFAAYEAFCREERNPLSTTRSMFSHDLANVVRGLGKAQRRDESDQRIRVYIGIRLRGLDDREFSDL